MEAAQVSINKWVDKTTMGYLHNGILLGHKKEENFTLCDNLDVPGEHYARWNKPLRERQILYDLTHCGIKWTNWTSKDLLYFAFENVNWHNNFGKYFDITSQLP